MHEHLSDRQIVAALSPAASAWASVRHLERCPTCRERAATLLRIPQRVEGLLAEFADDDAGEHLAYEVLERLVDGAANGVDREVAMAHLAGCAACRLELDDLRRFAQASRPRPARSRRGRRWLAAAALALVGGAAVLALLRTVGGSEPPRDGGDPRARPATARTPSPGAISPTPPPSGTAVVARVEDRNGPVLLLADGTVEGLPPALVDAGLRRALADGGVAVPAWLPALAAGRETLRGGGGRGDAIVLDEPLGRVVESATPRLTWRGPEDTYRVEIYDEELALVASGPAQKGRSWVVGPPLSRGHTYSWQVRRSGNDGEEVHPRPPEPLARFRVLDRAGAAEIAAARASGSHLATALALARHGLLDGAVEELERLVALDPGAPLPARLLQQVERIATASSGPAFPATTETAQPAPRITNGAQ